MTSGKNKGTWKLEQGFYFANEERRRAWVEEKFHSISKWELQKKERSDLKKTARENMANPFEVGQVFYDSWGFEQTNIDFYQITEVKEKSVVIREIGQKIVKDSEGFMCESVTPHINNFIGEPMVKTLQVRAYNGQTEVYINGCHRGQILLYDGGERGLYQSHYA